MAWRLNHIPCEPGDFKMWPCPHMALTVGETFNTHSSTYLLARTMCHFWHWNMSQTTNVDTFLFHCWFAVWRFVPNARSESK